MSVRDDWTCEELREEYEVLVDECAALRDENAELRVSYDTLKRIATEQLTVYAEHEQSWRAENAKLRELVKLTVFIIETMESVTSWRFKGDGKVIDSAYLWDKLHELGIEVDE